MLCEELTRQRTTHKPERETDTRYYALTQAELQPCLKSLRVEGKLTSSPELTLVYSRNNGNWILSLVGAEGRVSPLLMCL